MQKNQHENLVNPFSTVVFGTILGATVGLVYALVLHVAPGLGIAVAGGMGLVASSVIGFINPDSEDDDR